MYNDAKNIIPTLLDVPQMAATKLVTGKYQKPSEALVENNYLDKNNKWGQIAADIILDPLNLIPMAKTGVGLKGEKFATAGDKVFNSIKAGAQVYDNTEEVLQKFAYGTGYLNIENPNTALVDNEIAHAKGALKAENGWTKALDIVGNTAVQVGNSMMTQGMSQGQGTSAGGFNWGGIMQSALNGFGGYASSGGKYALGGTIGANAEVEGGEVFETPNGQVGEFEGPTHEGGGIPVNMPEGTDIFSERIAIDGKTMAERKKMRERKETKLQKNVDRTKDNLSKTTLKRVKNNNSIQEEKDKTIQGLVSAIESGKPQQFKYGTGPSMNPAYNPAMWNWGNMVSNPNLGYMENTSNFGKNFGANIPQDFYSLAQGVAGANNYNLNFSNPDSIKGFQSLLGASQDGVIGNDTYSRMQKYALPSNLGQPNGFPTDTTPSSVPTTNDMVNPNAYDSIGNSFAGGIGSTGLDLSGDNSQAESSTGWGAMGQGFLDSIGNLTGGDIMGIFGNLQQGNAGLKTTLENRAGDTPNINAFENYGKDGLKVLDEAKRFAAGIRDSQLLDIESGRASSSRRLRNSARGVNTMRAGDLAIDSNVNNARSGVNNNYLQTLQSILMQEAGMENQQDQMVMQGEQGRDLADRQDRDNFYTNLGAGRMQKSEALSRTGKALNQSQSNKATEELMNSMFGHVKGNSKTGKVSGVPTQKDSGMTFKTQYPELETLWKGKINPVTGKEFTTELEYLLSNLLTNQNTQ